MDVLAGYQPRASVGLDEMATLLGFPGKQGMRGDQVWDTYQAGGIKQIRDYCETDVLNTYLVYLRFLLIRGDLFEASYLAECERVREALVEEDAPHLRAFLDEWQAA